LFITMPIVITSPTDEPHGCLHPDASCAGFRADGVYWLTVASYCLAQELVEPEDRETVRMHVRDLAEARTRAATMRRHPDAAERALAALPFALRRACEHDLWLRAVLVDTGDQPIEARLGDDAVLGVGSDGQGRNELGRALAAVRAEVRVRALDADAIQCEHPAADETAALCAHLLTARPSMRRHHRWFTGDAARYALVCPACRVALPAAPPLRKVCTDCFESWLGGEREPDVGMPAFRRRATDLRFERRPLATALTPARTLAIAPIPRIAGGWLALDRDGRFHRVDAAGGSVHAEGVIAAGELDLDAAVVLVVAPGGALAAVGEAEGRRAIVVAPATGTITLRRERDDYHPDVCRFPLAWCERAGQPVLVHASEWNRLDLCDPLTGACLSERGPTSFRAGEERPAHYLDYFHAGLVSSPSGRFILDNGWVWHPWGVPRVFEVERWLAGNPWESEDGPSVHDLGGRGYHWDGAVAWLDERTVALWGEGDDEVALTPAALVYDAETGVERIRFPGPARGLAATGGLLLSFAGERGTDVWDPATGEQLHHDPALLPIAAHPTSGELLAWRGGGLEVVEVRGSPAGDAR
jgi:predicted NAD-dependent protein-ADP-ribosyltransferase YbiA (DUF1768 family)